MTKFEIEFLNQIAERQFTITSATDWPMFLAMGGLLFVMFVGAWGIIVKLLIYGFNDIKTRISSQRAEDTSRCDSCKSAIWEHIDGPVWNAINEFCTGWSKKDKEHLRDSIKSHTDA